MISPLLLNIALHGLEEAAGVRYYRSGISAGNVRRGSPVLTRYADDLVVCCHSRQQAEEVKARLARLQRDHEEPETHPQIPAAAPERRSSSQGGGDQLPADTRALF